MSSAGLSIILETITKFNKTLRFLDISYNVIDIGILRALRQLLERNTTLNYLSVSHLHKFNQRATESLQESLSTSTGIKLLDVKKTSRPFFFAMDQGVNMLRESVGKPRIIFLRDSTFVNLG